VLNVKICPVVSLSAISTTITVGTAYSQTIAGSNGVAPYVFGVISGTPPAGLSLNPTTGVLSGTPTSTTSQTFAVSATDANGCSGTRSYTLAPVCPAITVNPATLPVGTVGVAYSQTLTGSGGTAPYTFAVTAGTLPAGLTLTSAGVLSGTPTLANGPGTSVTITATDTYDCQAPRAYTIKICPLVSLPAITTTGTVGTAFSQTAAATGGVAPYTFAVTSGTLPGGLSLNANTGAITGTPNVEISSTITLTATDANGCPGSRSYTLAMSCPPITITPATLPNGTVGTAYTSTTFTAAGGTAPYQFSIISGTLPAGLTLTTAGVLSGTPTASNGSGSTITVQALDALNCPGTRAYTIKICPVITLPAISTSLTVGTSYTASVAASGGATPYVYAVSSGSLPAGLSLNTATGGINGGPINTTSQTFTITATDANVCVGTRSYTLAPVCPTITITPASLTRGTVGVA